MKMKRKVLSNVLSALFITTAISCTPINATELGDDAQKSEEAPIVVAAAEPQQQTAPPMEMMAEAAPAEPVVFLEGSEPVDPKTVNPNRQLTPGGADLYKNDPQPLTVTQCAQCHTSVFNKIKNDGNRHRLQCQDCHQQFHAYNPRKNNFEEIMPKCTQCHVVPHGPNFPDCMTCHIIPHTPLNIQYDDMLKSQCGNCHTNQSGQLQQFPSAHTEQGCATCHHTKHGNIPTCFECHEPHLPNQPFEECVSCHQVHKPLEITYEAGTESTCGTCHTDVYETWTASPSKHSGVACARCHEKHGQIPECTKCHTPPHDPKMLAKFPRCLDCHIDPHNPPVNK